MISKHIPMKSIISLTALTAFTSLPTSAAVTITLPGNSESSGWNQLKNSNPFWAANSYPTAHFNASNPWPTPVSPNRPASSGSATFNKSSGGGYFAGGSLYDAGIAGNFSVSDASPISNLATVVFQIDAGTTIGTLPTLSYNGGSQQLAPHFTLNTNGSYPTFNFTTGQTFPSQNRAWQWDLTGLGVASYEINWGSTANNHLTQYEINLTTGDTFVQAIPEPSATLAALLGLSLTTIRRRHA